MLQSTQHRIKDKLNRKEICNVYGLGISEWTRAMRRAGAPQVHHQIHAYKSFWNLWTLGGVVGSSFTGVGFGFSLSSEGERFAGAVFVVGSSFAGAGFGFSLSSEGERFAGAVFVVAGAGFVVAVAGFVIAGAVFVL